LSGVAYPSHTPIIGDRSVKFNKNLKKINKGVRLLNQA